MKISIYQSPNGTSLYPHADAIQYDVDLDDTDWTFTDTHGQRGLWLRGVRTAMQSKDLAGLVKNHRQK